MSARGAPPPLGHNATAVANSRAPGTTRAESRKPTATGPDLGGAARRPARALKTVRLLLRGRPGARMDTGGRECHDGQALAEM